MVKNWLKSKLIIIIGVLILSILLGICLGSVRISLDDIIKSLFSDEYTVKKAIISDIRLPRVWIAVFVGANLSASGALLQAVMRNPLADPGITGVSAGASLFAIIILLLFPSYVSLVPIAAFVGGVIACGIVYGLAWKGGGIEPIRIVLAGVAVNAILGGATGLLSLLNSDKIQGVMLWTNGSLSRVSWMDVKLLGIYSIVGIILALICIRAANVLQLGDDVAKNLGYNVNLTRILISLVAVYLAGISVAFVGIIGFVGLVVPHISRLLFGSDYKWLLPVSMLMGGAVLVIADTLARMIAAPIELPVGTMMAMLGGPFFLYLLRRGAKR
ncbi:FecCD family ABC transporter permease [Vallitalea guaymasensis]|uniref:Iron ABC transporter permease n=1 Tax=Vallitalea guaymasensis TaxID=1185412 RepID=A0A8J8M7S9_9FIRM|nr:iron ABC transporter permease [Vallitalea guaymasensis]QUH27936.1 iron ABC transporter permease [Vallitalea guaymasensis]